MVVGLSGAPGLTVPAPAESMGWLQETEAAHNLLRHIMDCYVKVKTLIQQVAPQLRNAKVKDIF